MATDAERRCWSCGAHILQATAERNFGRCRPCAKKGWYGRLWEVLTGTGRRSPPKPSKHVNNLRAALGLEPSDTPTVERFLADVQRASIAVVIDWRSEPDEILSELRKLPRWVETLAGAPPEPADEVVHWVARALRSRGLRLVNIQPGTDGWLLVILPPEHLPEVTKWAKRSGLGKPDPL